MKIAAIAPLRVASGSQDAARLGELIDESVAAGIAREVLWFSLSLLPSPLAEPHHLRLAGDALAPLEAADRVRKFVLPNDDLVVTWRGPAHDLVAQCEELVRHLFADEPSLLPEPRALLQRFHLPSDAAPLRDKIAVSHDNDYPILKPAPAIGAVLTLARLALLEADLTTANVARFARRRDVCVRQDDGSFGPGWESRVLSIRELADTLAPEHDLRGDPWLFRRLTRSLDRRMLALLAAPEELRSAGPFGINLNVGSILASDFMRFDEALPGRLRGHVVIGLDAADVMGDPAAFGFARDFARARQYLLMLRGLSPAGFALLPRARLGVDLVQIHWSPGWAESDIDLGDPADIVVAGTDVFAALDWGRLRGIRHFQGRIVAPASRRNVSHRL